MLVKKKRVVITKDADFYYSFLTMGQPDKLIFVKLGNTRIRETNEYLEANYHLLLKALKQGSLIELWPDSVKIIY